MITSHTILYNQIVDRSKPCHVLLLYLKKVKFNWVWSKILWSPQKLQNSGQASKVKSTELPRPHVRFQRSQVRLTRLHVTSTKPYSSLPRSYVRSTKPHARPPVRLIRLHVRLRNLKWHSWLLAQTSKISRKIPETSKTARQIPETSHKTTKPHARFTKPQTGLSKPHARLK